MKEIENFNSIEEFISKNKRFPNIDEWKVLRQILWEKYIHGLNENEKILALENDKLEREFQQEEIKKRISISTERFKSIFIGKGNKDIISAGNYERWGSYQIYVFVNCQNKENLYLFRKNIPNFFEGWYLELCLPSMLKQFLFYLKRFFKR